MSYCRLTTMERYQIAALKGSGISIREMARSLKRSPSTISREISRNSTTNIYGAKLAGLRARARRAKVKPPYRILSATLRTIKPMLVEEQWSPEQITAVLKSRKVRISPETIYKYIYRDRRNGGDLYLNLRRHRAYRRSRKALRASKYNGFRRDQLSFSERPKIVEYRKRLGDFERDCINGQRNGPLLLTIVDRTSRLVKIARLERVNADETHKATVRLLKKFKTHTLTNDNGPEFARHKKTAKALGIKVYFNDPYCSWQRGTSENTNGLIRQYYPKNCDFKHVTQKDLEKLEHKLNSRPRKCLGFKTPYQVHELLS